MSGHYDKFGLYHDREDRRLIVPKQVASFGWTVNVDHRFGKAVVVAMFASIVVLVGLMAMWNEHVG